MTVEPRFRMQVESLVLKDGRARALNNALSPADRCAFNAYLAAVIAVLLVPRFPSGCGPEEVADFSEEVAAAHRAEQRPVNAFVIEEVLRTVYGLPSLFGSVPVPANAVSTAGAAVLRHLNNMDARVAAGLQVTLDTAETLIDRAQ